MSPTGFNLSAIALQVFQEDICSKNDCESCSRKNSCNKENEIKKYQKTGKSF